MVNLGIGLVLITLVVSGVIGFAILDSIIATTTNYQWKVNETLTKTGAIGVSNNATVSCAPVIGIDKTVNSTGHLIGAGNYSVFLTPGIYNFSTYWNNTELGTSAIVTYSCNPGTYLSSSLSRTIVTYIVPIGMLGLIAIIAAAAVL